MRFLLQTAIIGSERYEGYGLHYGLTSEYTGTPPFQFATNGKLFVD